MELEKMSNKQLKQEYLSYYQTIYEVECYGKRDLLMINAIERELDNRGIEIDCSPRFNN